MKRTIIEVEWDDHAFYPGEYSKGGFALQYSVGYLVKETRDKLKIAQSIQAKDKKFYEVLVIDKRTVRTVRRLDGAA